MKKSKFLQSSKDMLHRSFKPEKCKTSLRLVASRLKLIRNKKEVQVKHMRREIAQLLESGQDQTARIRVEHVIREEKMMSAYELISLYSELILSCMPIIESQKNCPIDLKEAITSLVFASPRCGDVPELDDVRKQFTAKYGKDFISAAIELRPDSGVSRMLVEKLSTRAPDGQTKLKILTGIAGEYSIEWDPKSFGENGVMTPNDFLPEQNTRPSQGTENSYYTHPGGGGSSVSSLSQNGVRDLGSYSPAVRTETPVGKQSFSREGSSSYSGRQSWNMEFKDAASAAQAAAESAEQASMAARAAAELASHERVTNQYYTEPKWSGVNVQRANSTEKHLSSNLAGEQFPRESSSAFSTDTEPMSRNEQAQGNFNGNLRGADRRSDNVSYESPKKYSQPPASSRSPSIDDGSFAHVTQDADIYYRKDLLEEGSVEPKIFPSCKSGYESDLQKSSRQESDDYIEEKNSVNQSITSSRLHSSNYGDNNSSDFHRENIESHAFAGHFVGNDNGSINRDIPRTGSEDAASAVSDESGSDDEKGLYDTGPNFDEPGSDVDVLSLGRTSPFNVFTDPAAWDSGFSNNRSPDKSVSSRQNSTKEPSSLEFFELPREPVNDIKLDDSASMKFDDSDGIHSESEESTDELEDSGTNYTVKVLGVGNRGSEVQGTTNHKTELYSDSLDKKSSERPVDDETLSRTSSDVKSKLDYGRLTGGLRHKGYTLPPYTINRLDDVSSQSNKPAEESSRVDLESPASPAARFPPQSEANFHLDKKSFLARNSLSDTDSSEDELPLHISSHRKPHSQKSGKLTLRKPISKGTVTYFGSDSEEDLPKQTFAPKNNNLRSGLSRRTKDTAVARTSKTGPAHEELKVSDSGAERKSSGVRPLKEPGPQTGSLGHSRNFEQSSSPKASSERIPDSKMTVHRESPKSTAVEQPASPQPKVDDAIGSTKSSQASLPAEDTLDRVDSSKKASHVHPKLPDYDNLFANLQALRESRK